MSKKPKLNSKDELNNEYKRFVKYLDQKKKRKHMSLQELTNFVNNVNTHYYENQYYSYSHVGMIKGYNFDFMKSSSTNNYYPNIINNTNTTLTLNTSDFQEIHDLLSYNKPITPTKPESPKKKVEIEANVKGLNDLVKIIDTYEYKENEEYNINLKLLKDIEPELKLLNGMIGMHSLKDSIANQLLYFLQELHISEVNMDGKTKTDHEYKHTVISGPPGTGKTEIAQIIGKMYSKIGILKKNSFKKVTRNDLIAGYLGQTALKTRAVIDECLGGVLFIDEVYSLANTSKSELDSYSKECIDTLNECLSNHKENLMVIVAGYEEDNNHFFEANKGLYSRFIWRFKIDNYDYREMYQIYQKKVKETDWVLDEDESSTQCVTDKWFDTNKSEFKYFGRDMELLFTYTKISHSRRIFGKPTIIKKKITLEDLNNGLALFKLNRKKEDSQDKNIREILSSMYI
jgi:hypothetical protein